MKLKTSQCFGYQEPSKWKSTTQSWDFNPAVHDASKFDPHFQKNGRLLQRKPTEMEKIRYEGKLEDNIGGKRPVPNYPPSQFVRNINGESIIVSKEDAEQLLEAFGKSLPDWNEMRVIGSKEAKIRIRPYNPFPSTFLLLQIIKGEYRDVQKKDKEGTKQFMTTFDSKEKLPDWNESVVLDVGPGIKIEVTPEFTRM